MLKNFFVIILFSIISYCRIDAQIINENHVFEVGEEFTLDAYYNVGFLWFKVGVATFSVSEYNNNYVFTVTAKNLPKWDWLYEVRTHHEASCTKDMKPLYMKCQVFEKGVYYEDQYVYEDKTDHHLLKRHRIMNNTTYDTVFSMPHEVHDIINSIYVARNVDFSENEGKNLPFYPLFGNQVHRMLGSLIGKETITTKDGVTYNCDKYTAHVGPGTIVDKDPVYVYLTDDGKMIPVLIEAKLSIGYVKVYLHSVKYRK